MKTYDLSGLCVLVVDPNAFMREILREMLDGLGVGRVIAARSIPIATARLEKDGPIDVVVMELDLENQDGLDLIHTIRTHADPMVRMLPLVVVTADTRLARIAASRDAGATEFLAKPISAEGLYRRLVQIIERPRPFVRVGAEYFGPDRRRRIAEFAGGGRRDGDTDTDQLSSVA